MYKRFFLISFLLIFVFFFNGHLMAKGLFWQLENAQKTKKAYFLGSIHLANESLYPLNNNIMKAFVESETLFLEIERNAENKKEIMIFLSEYGFADKNETLFTSLSPALAKMLKESKYYNASLEKTKPWLATIMLSVFIMESLGFKESSGLDNYFENLAQEKKIKIISLEKPEESLLVFKNLSLELQELLLKNTLENKDDIEEILKKTIESWKKGDAEALNNLILEPVIEFPQLKVFFEYMYNYRNEKMAQKIDENLQIGKSSFIVIGAGHLVGSNSVLTLMEAKGYKITKID